MVLANQPVSHRQLAELAAQGLEELTLFEVGLDDAGAEVFAAHCMTPTLRSLTAPWNKLTARGLRALLRAPGLQRLERLHLYNNQLGVEGIEVLAAEAPPHLDSLNVCFNGL